MDQQRIDLAQDNTVSVEFPRRQNRPTEQSVDDINMVRARETSTLSRINQDTRSRDDDIHLFRYLHAHQQRITHNSPSAHDLLYLHRSYYEDLLVLLDEVGGRSRGLTKDQISRIPTRVFKSDTGTDTTKCKRCTRRNNRNAAILGIINSEQPSCSAKVDDGDSKGAKGVEAMDATKECNICMSEFVNNEKLRILTCFHEFHIKCIDQWIQVNSTCPLCRAQVQI